MTSERGQSVTEYAVLLAVILLIVLGGLRVFGPALSSMLQGVVSSIQ